jgi:MFS family permease
VGPRKAPYLHLSSRTGRALTRIPLFGGLLVLVAGLVSFVTAPELTFSRRRDSVPAPLVAVSTVVAAEPPVPHSARSGIGLPKAFGALAFRDFRLLITGVFFSLVGLWVFFTAQAWLALELTGSNTWVSIVSSAESLPFLFVSLFAGVLADRVDRKKLMLSTRLTIVGLMLAEAAVVASGGLQPWHLVVFSLASGVVFSLDLPTRQSLVADLVPPEYVHNAVALQISTFNLTMVLGPAIGAYMLAVGGSAWAFVITGAGNALLALLVLMMRVPKQAPHGGVSALRQLKDGLGYVYRTPAVRWILTLALFVTTFGFAYQVLLPALAADVFEAGEGGYGTLAAAGGFGALVGSLVVAFLGNLRRRSPILFAGPLVFSLALIALSGSPTIMAAAGAIFFAGAASSVYQTMNNTVVLTTTPTELRGRVMSVSILIWGLTPLGSLAAGILADSFGVRAAIGISALVGVAATLTIFSTRKVMRSF